MSATIICPNCYTKNPVVLHGQTGPVCGRCKMPFKGSPLPVLVADRKLSPMAEYRRTCQACGKMWHSLASREQEVQGKEKSEAFMQGTTGMAACGTCGMTLPAAAQHSRNKEVHTSELQRLRSCPECQSANYREEIVQHNR